MPSESNEKRIQTTQVENKKNNTSSKTVTVYVF